MAAELLSQDKQDWNVPKPITGPFAGFFTSVGKQAIERNRQKQTRGKPIAGRSLKRVKPGDQYREEDGFIF